MPKRIQLKRAKGWRMPACAKKVDRSTRWGNPFNATQIGATFQHAGVPAPIIHLQAHRAWTGVWICMSDTCAVVLTPTLHFSNHCADTI